MLLMTIESARERIKALKNKACFKSNKEVLKSKAKIMSNSEELLDLISGFEMMLDCFEAILYNKGIEDPDPIGTATLLKEMDDTLHEVFSLTSN